LLSSLDFVQVEALCEKVFEAESLEEMRRWVKAVRHN
jgi:hypothetical protein